MQEIKTFICRNCGGIMKWNIQKQRFECTSCRNPADLETELAEVEEHDLDEYAQRDAQVIMFPDETLVTCSACGAQIRFDKTRTATVCPMCASTQVSESRQSAGVPPDGIIPFQIDKNEAQVQFRKWIKSRWFAPNRLKQAYQEGKLEGIYIPFWTYDADAEGEYSGEGGTEYEEEDADGKKRTEVRWRAVRGHVSASYDDIAVCASDGREAETVDKILPFNTSEGSLPYSSAYLSGFAARRYAVRADEAVAQAKGQIEADLQDRAAQDIKDTGYDRARVNSVRVEYNYIFYKHVLLPAWISVFNYGGKPYIYMINGETGKVGGQRPYSVPKILTAVLIALAVIVGFFVWTTTEAEAAVLPPVSIGTATAGTVHDSGLEAGVILDCAVPQINGGEGGFI